MDDRLESWPFFEHARVINLDKRADRWDAMQRQFRRLGIQGVQRFAAISPGAEVVEQAALQPLREFLTRVDGDSERLESKLRATWGCMRSHLGIIREARAQGWPYVLILEDDCELEPYALPVLRRAAEQLAAQLRERLQLDDHGSSADGSISLRPVYCLGACACSPALELDGQVHARLTPERLSALVSGCLQEVKPC